ncbi:UPF0182 family protein [Candidatus Woesearchaeota archaeon]|nr:UPF0182 family protein [Candidatus Woesearchaeota archaeon]
MNGGNIVKNNILGFIILIVAALFIAAGLYADWLWFDSLSYLSVFKTVLFSKIIMGITAFLAFFSFLWLNFIILKRRIKVSNQRIYFSVMAAVSVIAGIVSSSYWFTALRFLDFTGFGFVDPVFRNDIGFYIFVLPFYNFVLMLLFFMLIAAIIMAAVSYAFSSKPKKMGREEVPGQNMPFGFEPGFPKIKMEFPKKGKAHLAYLSGILLLVAAAFFYLKRYSVLASARGAVYGAGYTDIHIIIPLYFILAIISLATALIAFSYSYMQNAKLVIIGMVVLLVALLGGNFVAGIVQLLYVEPNEFNLEEPYIKQNIKHTLFAYGLTEVNARDFPVAYNLTLDDIRNNPTTINSVRLWDWRPLLTTSKQIQLFRTYYDFVDVDVDRYIIDGELRQLMLSPRELDQKQLDRKAQTWVNQKFVYTHGYGIVASPVNVVTQEGLPELFVKDIPPKTAYEELEVSQPRIYFGEKTDGFVVVNTKAKEFDYPLGNENVFATYEGRDGVQLSNMLRKTVFSIKLASLNLLVSSAVTDESKVLLRRNIIDRIKTIAPFLEYDTDPYIVINDGRLFWIIDAYTTTNKFPYSESVFGLNYVRNAVKVVVDVYNGDVNFYIIDKEDPLIKNYAKIFPSLFKDFKEMPLGLKEHIRYPEDLFKVQTRIYGTYHMKDPQVFYNKEDVWRTPMEVFESNQIELSPYYIIMKLPDADKEGFFLIIPLIPRGKENMIAWFTANSDPENYGKLEVFELSKQELTFGPMQIEARINQDTEISQLFTLWNQQGSEVIRGNLIVIPIEKSFLYIEPVYLKASATGALPQFKRVIVAYDDKVTMQETLEDALNVVFSGKAMQKQSEKIRQETGKVLVTLEEKFAKASQLYEEAQAALQQGDFAAYANKIEELGKVLGKD